MSNGYNHDSNLGVIRSLVVSLANMHEAASRAAGCPSARKNQRVAALDPFVHQLIKIYLDEWKQQVDNSITDARMPEDAKSRLYWYLALFGNLLWAATCFVPSGAVATATVSAAVRPSIPGARVLRAANPTARVALESSSTAQSAIKAMSFTGATLGSGTVEQFRGNTKDPEKDGKRILRELVARKRGELEKVFSGKSLEWASDIDALVQWGDDSKQATDRYLWVKMFPRIPYDEARFVTIYNLALANVHGALEEFTKQWKDWSFRKERSGPEWKRRRVQGEYWDYSLPDPGDFRANLPFDILTG